MTHHPAPTDPTTPLTTTAADQPQHDHATTAQPTSHQRYKINNQTPTTTAYPRIEIRRKSKSHKQDPAVLILESARSDRERRAPTC